MTEPSTFNIRPPSNKSNDRHNTARKFVASQRDESLIPSVWAQIQKEQESIIEAPLERAKEQRKTDLTLKVKAATSKPTKANNENENEEEEDNDIIDVRAKIETLLDEHKMRALENESNLVELRIVLENLGTGLIEEPAPDQIGEAEKYMGQVQEGQERLQESINYLVKGAAQLFIQKNKAKVEKLRADINDIAFMTAQVDEQIRLKNGLLEEKLNSCAKIDASNATLRRRIETTKNEIRAIAGQDFESIPELARTYNESMKRLLNEEIGLTKQLWELQAQLEKEKKEQVQMNLMFQKVKEHPIRVAQLKEENEGKLAALRAELFEKEKANSMLRGQAALQFQTETQKMVVQARKEREEQLFAMKMQQLQAVLAAEKQARDDKAKMIAGANSALAGNKAFRSKLQALERESKAAADGYEATMRQLKADFAQAERRLKREQDARVAEAEEKARARRRAVEGEVAAMEASLAAKDEQYRASAQRLADLQQQLAALKEKIARIEVSNQQLENAIGGTAGEGEDLMVLLAENEKRKTEEKEAACRKMLDTITSLAYFMVLSGQRTGDWLAEARRCYEEALVICEGTGKVRIPVPFSGQRRTKDKLLAMEPEKQERRHSSLARK